MQKGGRTQKRDENQDQKSNENERNEEGDQNQHKLPICLLSGIIVARNLKDI